MVDPSMSPSLSPPADPAVIKACCAAGYQSDLVGLVLGDSYHPGGPALTRRLAEAAGIGAGDEVLDVASGPGTTALLLALEYCAAVVGVDLGSAAVDSANARAEKNGAAGVGPGRARFVVGDAERLPLPDASVDVVVSECALCTFPDKAAAAAEMARVLRPGGRVGITDVVIDAGRLDPELADLAGWVACLADARPVDGYRTILADAGLHTVVVERHDQALADMIDRIDARIAALAMTGAGVLAEVDLSAVRRRIGAARRAVEDGNAGYALIVARSRD
ncbi:MAG: class I SAM-dependent methyltransferase [Acidimicrobiales bacterium]